MLAEIFFRLSESLILPDEVFFAAAFPADTVLSITWKLLSVSLEYHTNPFSNYG